VDVVIYCTVLHCKFIGRHVENKCELKQTHENGKRIYLVFMQMNK